MKVKLIFESDKDGETNRFGYIIDKATMSYKTVRFDQRYAPFETHENKPIGDITVFGKSMWRLIRSALSDGK